MMKTIGLITMIAGFAAVMAVAAPGGGLKKGEAVTPFHPKHLAGPLAGSTDCFPCTFQNRPQVQVWVNGDSLTNVAGIAGTLSSAMKTYKAKEFKGLVVFLTTPKNAKAIEAAVAEAAKKPELAGVGMAVLDAKDDAVSAYKVNTAASTKNVVYVYKNWKVAESFVNLGGDAAGQKTLAGAIASVTK